MGKKIYVGNLPWSADDAALSEKFSQFGTVKTAQVVNDRESGRSRGFGFVEFETEAEASAAIAGMNEKDMDGRTLKVNEAQEKPRSDNRGGGNSRGGKRRDEY